jgi:hypothetical protein
MYQKIRIWVCSRVSALVLPQPVTKRLLTIRSSSTGRTSTGLACSSS